jgi:hypothetical protein
MRRLAPPATTIPVTLAAMPPSWGGTLRRGNMDSVIVAEWMERLRAELGDEPALSLTADEERALLELARVAAHSSERIAAPLTTFLAGVALAHLPPGPDRAARLRGLTEALQA